MAVDFCDYFWGDKNNGFDALYQNMKFGLVASKELVDFLRERASTEEAYSKQLSRIAKQCGSATGGNLGNAGNSNNQPNATHNGPICTFTPLWQLLKSSCDKLSTLQFQVSQKLADLVKDIGKYSDELARKHKVVKESESITVEAIQVLNQTTVALQRAKETYVQRGAEVLKLRKDGSTSARDLERAEVKFRKATEDYKALVEKHAQQREDFERKMTVSCRHFQEVEEGHVNQMRNFLNSYVNVLCNNYESMGQAHVELRQQWDELTAEKLLEIFVVSKMTGLEKPSCIEFEEFPMDTAVLVNLTPQQLPEYLEESAPSTSAAARVKEEKGGDSCKKIKKTTESKSKDKKDKKQSKNSEGSRRATSLLNLFTSSSSSPSSQGKIKKKRKSPIEAEPEQGAATHSQSEETRGGSAPSTPSECVTSTSPTGWSRTSLRGSKSDESPPQSSASSSAPSSASGLGIASWTAGFLKSRRDRKKEKEKTRDKEKEKDKKTLRKKRDSDASSVKSESDLNAAVDREKEKETREEIQSAAGPAETAENREVDEEGYRIRPKEETWPAEKAAAGFYSSSDSDSDEEPERKLHVEIKPLSNGAAQSSVSVDELRATIENLNINTSMFNTAARKNASMESQNSTSQLNLGKSSSDLVGINFFSSPTNSNTSTPIAAAPTYGSVTSPTGTASPVSRHNTATPVAEDLFAEIGEIVPALPPKQGRQPATGSRGGTPTLGTIAIPRPPSRRGSELLSSRIVAASPLTLQSSTSVTTSPTMTLSTSRTESMGSLESRPGATMSPVASLSRSSSRSAGPSPITVSTSSAGQTGDAIPLAVAFQEVVHALFKGADESRCQVKIEGDMLLSFPAGLVQLLDTQLSSIPQITFRIKNYSNLENVVPNRQLITMEQDLMSPEPEFHFNMGSLTTLLKTHVEQNPTAAFFNVTILKYAMKVKHGAGSAPLHLVSYWKCEKSHTDLRVDYKFNSHAQPSTASLRKLQISVPVEGGVTAMQSKPQGQWVPETNRGIWTLPDLSAESEGSNVGGLRARFALKQGPGSPTNITAQFACDGSTLSGAEFELVSSGYRISLAKRRYVSGKYICDSEIDMRNRYAAPPGPTSTEC